jgi:hypothetical protein
MEKEKGAMDAKAVLFKRLYGVKPATFKRMLSILQRNTMPCKQFHTGKVK